MKFFIKSLIVIGNNKKPAILNFDKKSHLIFGPTDTGKSYIVECIRFCLGDEKTPKDVGFSEGYSLAILQIESNNGKEFTISKSLANGQESVHKGIYSDVPVDLDQKLDLKVDDFLITENNIQEKKILVKLGTLGRVTANDLRRISIFDEIQTLDNINFEGKDSNTKVRNRSALSFFLTGSDDSKMPLAISTDARNQAKGQVSSLQEQIQILNDEIPKDTSKEDVEDNLDKIFLQIDEINKFLSYDYQSLRELKSEFSSFEREINETNPKVISLIEAKEQFSILDQKYLNDISRLEMTNISASIVANLPNRSCPICLTTLDHQKKHHISEEDFAKIRSGAVVEIQKINRLRDGLKYAIEDIESEISELSLKLNSLNYSLESNKLQQKNLLEADGVSIKDNLNELTERKAELSIYLNNFKIIQRLQIQLEKEIPKSKRMTQKIERNIAKSATDLSVRIKELLEEWKVPDVRTIDFDDKCVDIRINQRARVSYGKGKRGIFLTAYMIALMELNIEKNLPHLGFILIDSPVVTYKDPKHSSKELNENNVNSDGELLPEGVKDSFYGWLATRKDIGQIIVLENEEPNEQQKNQLSYTEFFGPSAVDGERVGFFPVN
ncbi:AAA family ATPase [Acinetobacter sp.]|uniref:AAA family ATPase n=1 Tax=Acinetobacter sp. TaxID=472 RepID=UPI0033408B77